MPPYATHSGPEPPTHALTVRPALLAGMFWASQGALLILYVGYVAWLFDAADGPFGADGNPLGRDFVVFWAVAVLAGDGQPAGLYDPAHYQAQAAAPFARDLLLYVWVHPPPMLLVVLPLDLAPYLWALGAWSAAGRAAWWLAARRHALLVAPAVFINLLTGQTGLLLGARIQIEQRLVIVAERPEVPLDLGREVVRAQGVQRQQQHAGVERPAVEGAATLAAARSRWI